MLPNNHAIIILAAGASVRLGRPKQLVPVNGKTLLENTIDIATDLTIGPVLVVLGANANLIENEIAGKEIYIVRNNEWSEGMASSIRCGVKALLDIAPGADAVILMVCDQPYVSADLLAELILTQKRTGSLIVASEYDNTTGPPALFCKPLFSELLKLEGDAGARKIINQYIKHTATVLFPKGIIDIDTEDDYKKI